MASDAETSACLFDVRFIRINKRNERIAILYVYIFHCSQQNAWIYALKVVSPFFVDSAVYRKLIDEKTT
jgi:hypothetical protein